jgi:ketosteroid isomerase-like protein
MSEENVELVREAYEVVSRTREPAWELMAPDIEILNLHDAPWQPSPGIDGMRQWIDFANDVASEWSMEVDNIEDLGHESVLVSGRLRMKFRSTGIENEAPMVQLCRIADGRLTRLETHYTREQALEAAGLRE